MKKYYNLYAGNDTSVLENLLAEVQKLEEEIKQQIKEKEEFYQFYNCDFTEQKFLKCYSWEREE